MSIISSKKSTPSGRSILSSKGIKESAMPGKIALTCSEAPSLLLPAKTEQDCNTPMMSRGPLQAAFFDFLAVRTALILRSLFVSQGAHLIGEVPDQLGGEGYDFVREVVDKTSTVSESSSALDLGGNLKQPLQELSQILNEGLSDLHVASPPDERLQSSTSPNANRK
eukprot:CAMPEP_0206512290 /NCGR_PEP_ID=MMETSP0324_2-20121206/60791_1 /ASSEMBLY_ACC=CAM_ASM_000836 /TAXON_ID=2866 /ORGANISM="Crypthecodinium cohnii, Strain Seligo" /LENGTH=166 /DNA_ID=CAMNT_0054004219 /DNA_START=59 /DNA_END=557 /DNA_ORIENTATION=-